MRTKWIITENSVTAQEKKHAATAQEKKHAAPTITYKDKNALVMVI